MNEVPVPELRSRDMVNVNCKNIEVNHAVDTYVCLLPLTNLVENKPDKQRNILCFETTMSHNDQMDSLFSETVISAGHSSFWFSLYLYQSLESNICIMETEAHNVANPLAIDTSQVHAVADDDPSSANNFLTESPTTALGTYPAPPAQQMNMDSEKFQVEDEHQSAPIFTATGPKLSLSRSHTTSYQKQTFRMDAGINPAETIADRLEAWRGILKNLVSCLLWCRFAYVKHSPVDGRQIFSGKSVQLILKSEKAIPRQPVSSSFHFMIAVLISAKKVVFKLSGLRLANTLLGNRSTITTTACSWTEVSYKDYV
jgi:hypothetical protein